MVSSERHILSKSTFMYGCQCPKRLWLHKFKPELKDKKTETKASAFQQGIDVGQLARQRFPNGVDAKPETSYLYHISLAKTQEYINNGHNVIYEAAFQYNGILAALDILVKQEDGWYAYEVKSSTKVKPEHIKDAALQYYVITNSNINLKDIFILHLNSEYIRQGDLDLNQLFSATSILDEVKEMQPNIKEKVDELKICLQSDSQPNISTGKHCIKPYPCDFQGYCNYKTDVKDYSQTTLINQQNLTNFVKSLTYPLYYMDFETWSVPIPESDSHWPYRQVPFQFSVHKHHKHNNFGYVFIRHYDYLAESTHTPLIEFTEKLIEVLGTNGTILVYNKSFENSRLEELKHDFPHLSQQISNIQQRLVDLMTPFKNKDYYTPEMKGSYSIKYVLPALVKDLNYDDLVIGNGTTASQAFYELKHETDPQVIQSTRNALLEYCKLDTWAMIKILRKIKDEISYHF